MEQRGLYFLILALRPLPLAIIDPFINSGSTGIGKTAGRGPSIALACNKYRSSLMDPISLTMARHAASGCAIRASCTRTGCLPGRTRKNAHPLVSPETNRGGYRVHYLSYYLLSPYLNYRQKCILLRDSFPGMTLKCLTAGARMREESTLRNIRIFVSGAGQGCRTKGRKRSAESASSRIRPVVRHWGQ